MSLQMMAISRDLTGGVRITIGDRGFVLSPEDAIRMGTKILQHAGCNVAFANPQQLILTSGMPDVSKRRQ